MDKLSKSQETILKKHAVKYSKKHVGEMRKLMEKGTSFTVAHKQAQKKVGK